MTNNVSNCVCFPFPERAEKTTTKLPLRFQVWIKSYFSKKLTKKGWNKIFKKRREKIKVLLAFSLKIALIHFRWTAFFVLKKQNGVPPAMWLSNECLCPMCVRWLTDWLSSKLHYIERWTHHVYSQPSKGLVHVERGNRSSGWPLFNIVVRHGLFLAKYVEGQRTKTFSKKM